MIFHRPDRKRWLLVICAAMGMVLPSHAQRHHGQAIIFSQPNTDVATNLAPSLTPSSPVLPDFVRNISPPMIPTPPSLQPPPLPARMMSPAQMEAAQQEIDRQKNWTLLTPAEILGVPTLENTLGLPERNANGELKNKTALERYMDRQQRMENMTTTNAAAANALPDWSLRGRDQVDSKYNGFSPGQNNSLFSPISDNSMGVNQNAAGGWSQTFSAPAPAPVAQTPEQLAAAKADAANFQRLLQSGLSAPTPKTAPVSSWQQATPNSSTLPANSSPVGISYTPVSSVIITPQGVTPLIGPGSGKNPSTTPVVPEWKRKLPPWLSAQPSLDRNF